MANINGLFGHNRQRTSVNLLFAAYGNSIVNVATGAGYPVNLTSTSDVNFEQFIDKVYATNYTELPIEFDRTTWKRSDTIKAPRARYVKSFKNRLYLGNTQIATISPITWTFPSRVFYSNFPKTFIDSDEFPTSHTSKLTFGLTYGSNIRTRAGNPIVELDTASQFINFVAQGIKVGDPFTILDGGGFESTVLRVDSPYRLTLITAPEFTEDAIDFWVGSNWFDVSPDDGDEIKGFSKNSDRLLIFKLMSLWFYTGSQLKQVNGALGTSYNRSIINDRYGNTYYFHGSDPKITGIYKYNGVSSVKISKPIDPFIAGMAVGSYDNVIAWAEGNELRWYLVDLSATNLIEAMTNAVATHNVDTGTWSVDPIADIITVSTTWRTGNEEDTFLGTSDDEVLQADDGNSFNTANIRSRLQTKVYYPAGSEIICEFPYVQVIARNARGVRLKYRLWDNPTDIDADFTALGEISDDKTEFPLSPSHFTASGIEFLFDELSTVEADWYIEKISVFYRPIRTRIL